MSGDPPTLEALMFRWRDDYIFGYARDKWLAIRRDGIWFLAADTLTQLETEIRFDYGKNPVSRECDPLDAARDYLPASHGSDQEGTGDMAAPVVDAAEAITLDAAEKSVILHDLRALFPGWQIDYSNEMKAWTAHRKGATICENSPLLIHIALTRIDQATKHNGSDTSPG